MYVQNTAVFRGSIVNDGGSVTIGDDLVVTGKIGIGTTNPQKNLHIFQTEGGVGAKHATIRLGGYSTVGPDIAAYRVTGNSNDQGLIFSTYDATNGTVDTMTLTNAGNVGIGTTSPVQPLSVHGNFLVRTTNADGNKNRMQCIVGGSSDAANLYLYYGNSGDGTVSVRINAQGSSYFNGGAVGIGTTAPFSDLSINVGANAPSSSGNMASEGLTVHNGAGGRAVQIGVNESGAYNYIQSSYVNNSNVAVNLAFFTGASERMRINTSGNVGIGTTNPLYKVHTTGTLLLDTYNAYAIRATNGSGTYAPVFATSGNHTYYYNTNASGYLYWRNAADNGTIFAISNSGNVGIGTTLPAYKLQVSGAQNANDIVINNATTGVNLRLQMIDANGAMFTTGSKDLILGTNNTGRMRIDTGGSVMIGDGATSGTPVSDYRSLEIGRQGNTITGAPWKSNLYFSTNATVTAGSTAFTYRYISSAPTQMTMENGVFTWSNAVAGTVGNTISFTERMRISSSGNIGIGETSPDAKLHVVTDEQRIATFESSHSDGPYTAYYLGSTPLGFVGNAQGLANAGNTNMCVRGQSQLVFAISSSEKMRITSGGNLQMKNDTFLSWYTGAGQEVENLGIEGSDTTGTMKFYTEATERMRLTRPGDLCIGGTDTQTARTASFDVSTNHVCFDNCTNSSAGNGTEYQTFRRHNSSNAVQIGSIVMNGTSGVTYSTSSDYRLKENVVELTNALDRINQLKPSRFNFISDEGRTIDGFLAHEVSNIVPEAIVGAKDEVDEDGNPKYQSIDQSKLVPLLVGAVKELKAEIEKLKTQINGIN